MKAIEKTAVDGEPLLTYRFEIDNGAEGVSAETVIIDAVTGYEERTNRVWFKNENVGKAQDSASLISYAKRYSLSAAFGIASEDDDDAQAQIRNQEQTIDKAGIEIIVNEYLKDKTDKSKRWIKGKHDKATAEYIMQLIGKYKPSDFSPLRFIALIFLLFGSKYPPISLPFSSFFLNKLFFSANSCPNCKSTGK